MPLSDARASRRTASGAATASGYRPVAVPLVPAGDVAPAFGVALESTGVTWIHGRLTYRRVYNTGASNISEFASGDLRPRTSTTAARISSEKLGYAIDASLAERRRRRRPASSTTSTTRDDELYGVARRLSPARRSPSSADYDYYVPTYDADSIWNFFAGEPMNDVGLRAQRRRDRQALLRGRRPRARLQRADGARSTPATARAYTPYAELRRGSEHLPQQRPPLRRGRQRLGALAHGRRRCVALRGSGNWGDDGDRVGGDLSGAAHLRVALRRSARAPASGSGTTSCAPDRSTDGLQLRARPGVPLRAPLAGRVEWEHDISGLVGPALPRSCCWLTVAVTK